MGRGRPENAGVLGSLASVGLRTDHMTKDGGFDGNPNRKRKTFSPLDMTRFLTFFLETFYVLVSTHTKIAEGNPNFLAVSKEELCLCCERVEEPNSPSLELKVRQLEEFSPGLLIQGSGKP